MKVSHHPKPIQFKVSSMFCHIFEMKCFAQMCFPSTTAVIPPPCPQAVCSSSDPDLSHGGSDDQQQLQQARKLAAVMKIKNAIKTAEKLEPPAGAGSAQRRLSDASLDSPSQRRKSVDSPAGKGEGSGGGGSTSLHRSSSMKQQKTTSSGTKSVPFLCLDLKTI